MQTWLVRKLVNYQLKALRAGNPKPSLMLDSRKIEMLFPGDHSWGGVIRGKKAHKAWLQRFCLSGLQIFADEVVFKGTPLRGTICIRGTDHLDAADGERVYENRYVIWGQLRWGRLRGYEVYEDTAKVSALDDWLERTGNPAAPSAIGRRPGRGARMQAKRLAKAA
jgi:ketosteroid isomerase-like protein